MKNLEEMLDQLKYGMMEKLKDSMIGLVLKINRWSQTQRSDDDYDDR